VIIIEPDEESVLFSIRSLLENEHLGKMFILGMPIQQRENGMVKIFIDVDITFRKYIRYSIYASENIYLDLKADRCIIELNLLKNGNRSAL
jgi:hypothetical protein